jgi:hypothetical protein
LTIKKSICPLSLNHILNDPLTGIAGPIYVGGPASKLCDGVKKILDVDLTAVPLTVTYPGAVEFETHIVPVKLSPMSAGFVPLLTSMTPQLGKRRLAPWPPSAAAAGTYPVSKELGKFWSYLANVAEDGLIYPVRNDAGSYTDNTNKLTPGSIPGINFLPVACKIRPAGQVVGFAPWTAVKVPTFVNCEFMLTVYV